MAEVAAWVGAAVAFGLGVGAVMGAEKAEEFFAGYLLEQSLSVDNLFVFVLVFDYFKVPLASQPRVLNYGIWGAMVMRAAMIIAGYEAVTNFKPILLVFAGCSSSARTSSSPKGRRRRRRTCPRTQSSSFAPTYSR